jgi:biopolymer transport protein ExbD
MRGLFRRKEREVPGLNTSSLPDLIFTVLFFFMIVTHMRDVELKVRYEVPQGTEVQKLEHKASVVNIYVGHSQGENHQLSNRYYIQLNNQLATIDDIKAFIAEERLKMNEEDRARMTVSLKADKDVPVGLIADIKQMLQQSFALKINYSATEKQ